MENNCGIYCWTNKASNNKKYIGKASNLTNRKKQFLSFKSHYAGRRIDSARKHYNNELYWDYEILEYCTKEKLDEREIYYIDLYDTTNLKKGYNISIGGDGANGCILTEEHKIKLSKAHKGKKLSEEHKRRIGEGNRGKKISEEMINKLRETHKGKKLSEEHKIKLSESHKGKKASEETKRKMSEARKGEKNCNYGKNISEETKNKIKKSLIGKKASEETKRKMSEAHKGEKHHFYGKSHSDESKLKISKSKGRNIYQYDLNGNLIKEWEGIKQAASFYNVCPSSIRLCCIGKKEEYINYKWRYVEDYIKQYNITNRKERKKTVFKNKPKRNRKSVLQIDLISNEVIKEWESMQEAAKYLNTNYVGISLCCSGKTKTCKGFKWRYKNEND